MASRVGSEDTERPMSISRNSQAHSRDQEEDEEDADADADANEAAGPDAMEYSTGQVTPEQNSKAKGRDSLQLGDPPTPPLNSSQENRGEAGTEAEWEVQEVLPPVYPGKEEHKEDRLADDLTGGSPPFVM